jgi:hypothetical protein
MDSMINGFHEILHVLNLVFEPPLAVSHVCGSVVHDSNQMGVMQPSHLIQCAATTRGSVNRDFIPAVYPIRNYWRRIFQSALFTLCISCRESRTHNSGNLGTLSRSCAHSRSSL